ncbi:hypothetical protein [Ferrimonas balearica]|uniref:hypothetical protein n=1 Tax=Ferrimonas balearica TaxID=44012 RepID=UPI001C99B237|nr:hypothetical protein [Ferrimonas balearica]MBY5993923.1 hypothetical protein [Ferrimonas balearica]
MKRMTLWLVQALLPTLCVGVVCLTLRPLLGEFDAPRTLALMCLGLVIGVIWAERHRQHHRLTALRALR